MLADLVYLATLMVANALVQLCKVLGRCLLSLRKRSIRRDNFGIDLESNARLYIDRVCSDTIRSRRLGDSTTTSPAVDLTIARFATFKVGVLFTPASPSSVSKTKHANVATLALTLSAFLETVLSPFEHGTTRRLKGCEEKRQDKHTATGLCNLQKTDSRWTKAFFSGTQSDKAKALLMQVDPETNLPCKPPSPSQCIDPEIPPGSPHPEQLNSQREDNVKDISLSEDMSTKLEPLETMYHSLIQKMRDYKIILNISRQKYAKLRASHHKAKLVFCTGRFENWLKQECTIEGMMHEVSKDMRWYRAKEKDLSEEIEAIESILIKKGKKLETWRRSTGPYRWLQL